MRTAPIFLFTALAACLTAGVWADNHLPSDCDTARDRAKSKYGAGRHYFDALNRCMAKAESDIGRCRSEFEDQQSALGDFIFAQRVAQDTCGREGASGDLAQ